jgi:GTP cyclohydrolase II
MKNKKIELLMGDRQRNAVERAIAELRTGRPAVVENADGDWLVLAFEGLDAAWFEALRSSADARLVLTPARLRYLKSGVTSAGSVPLSLLSFETVEQLVLGEGDVIAPSVCAATGSETAALELVRLSLMLPAAIVVDVNVIAPGDKAAFAAASAQEIMAYEPNAAASLRLVSRAPVPLEGVEQCEFAVFRAGEGMRDQVAIIIGKPQPDDAVLVRIHSACLTGDLFGSLKCDCGDQLRGAVQRMGAEGGGVLLYLDQEGRGNGIANKIRAYRLQHDGHDTYDADEILGFENDHRRFDIAAEMLRKLGFASVRLMTNNPQKIKALLDGGLNVAATQRVISRANGHNAKYIAAKRDRAGHLFEPESSQV